jgi:hypothetical protein
MHTIAHTDLEVFPICLGCNVFGWTVTQDEAFVVLDAFAEAGGNFFDTSDVYWKFIPGNVGGESETIIGEWMRQRRCRDRMVVSTKIGALDGMTGGLTASNIRMYTEASMKRLGVDTIDLLYAHVDDHDTPLEETLSGFDTLVREGKVRYIAASRFDATRLAQAAAIAAREHLAGFAATQSLYSLVERDFETTHGKVPTGRQGDQHPHRRRGAPGEPDALPGCAGPGAAGGTRRSCRSPPDHGRRSIPGLVARPRSRHRTNRERTHSAPARRDTPGGGSGLNRGGSHAPRRRLHPAFTALRLLDRASLPARSDERGRRRAANIEGLPIHPLINISVD